MAAILPDLRSLSKRFTVTRENYPAAMKKDRTEFGSRLLKARKHAALTQTALANAVKMPQSTYGEAEMSGLGSTYTAQIAKKCGVDSVWLATGDGEMISKVIVWPFALITPEQVATIHPDRLITVQEVALAVVETRIPTVVPDQTLTHHEISSDQGGIVRQLTTRKSKVDAKRIQTPGKGRKSGGS